MDPVALVVGILNAIAGAYGGSLGAALLTAGFVLRLALLPLTLQLAVRAKRRAEALRALEPEIAALRERHASDPAALSEATLEVYRRAKISPIDPLSMLSTLLQLPVGATVWAAMERLVSAGASFRWIADLSAPDLGVAALVAAFSWASAALSAPDGTAGRVVPLIVAGVMFLVASRVMAGLGLYMAASASVGLLQASIVRARAIA